MQLLFLLILINIPGDCHQKPIVDTSCSGEAERFSRLLRPMREQREKPPIEEWMTFLL